MLYIQNLFKKNVHLINSGTWNVYYLATRCCPKNFDGKLYKISYKSAFKTSLKERRHTNLFTLGPLFTWLTYAHLTE